MKMNMKKLTVIIGTVALVTVAASVITIGIVSKKAGKTVYIRPDMEEIKSICSLATTEIDYNNVAKDTLEYWMFKTKTRKIWIEHRGIVKAGIDVNKLEVKAEGDVWTIKIPKAEILSVSCDPESFTEESFTISKGKLRKFHAEAQNAAMENAMKSMREDAESNSVILHDAQVRARRIMENYMSQLNEQTGKNIEVIWEME